MACSVVTATSLPTAFLYPSVALTRAAATSLGVCKAVGCFPGCSSLLLGQHNLGLTLRCRIRPRTRPHRHSTSSRVYRWHLAAHQGLTRMPIPARLVSTIRYFSLTSSALSIRAVATTSYLTSLLSRRRCLRETGRCTTALLPAIFAT